MRTRKQPPNCSRRLSRDVPLEYSFTVENPGAHLQFLRQTRLEQTLAYTREALGDDNFELLSRGRPRPGLRLEGAAEVGQLVEGGALNPIGVEMAGDPPITLWSAQRVGQHLVGDAVEPVVEVLVAATTAGEFS
jgi:hypothetical protein